MNNLKIIDQPNQQDKNINIKLNDFGSSQNTNNKQVNFKNSQSINNNQDQKKIRILDEGQQDSSSISQVQKNKEEDSPLPLIKTGTSLVPDMKFGWKPEVKCSHPPIPLYFDFVQHRIDCYQFDDNDFQNIQRDVLVYKSKDFIDSYQMHKEFSNKQLCNGMQSYKFNFPKNHDGGRFKYDGLIEQIFGSRGAQKVSQEDEFVGMNPFCMNVNSDIPLSQEYEYMNFNSNFESGNVDLVIKSRQSKSYDLFLRPDSNSAGYFQWFYFKIKNKLKGTMIHLNIVNLTKRNSLYQQGMPIQILSLKKSKHNGASWGFGGENIKYGISKVMNVNQQSENMSRRIYYQLSWDYTFEYDDDEVFFAYALPYTFSMVVNLVQSIQETQDLLIQEYNRKKEDEIFINPTINENSFKIVETSSLTTSLGGIDVPLITITNFSHTKEEEQKKKVIIITGRVHPGETNGSWLVHGIIKFLLSKDKIADLLRQRLIFKIIPMINADGVTVGNTRCSFIGKDVNRLFGHPNQKLTPEPYFLRQLIKDLQRLDKNKVSAYLDFHAHSGRKSIFMYGPYFPLHSSKYLKIRTIPKLISERTDMFRFFSCRFRIEKYKENCARIAIWRDFNITNCYAIEASSFGFLNKDRETLPFTTGLLQEFGECFIHSLFEFNLILDEDRKLKQALEKRLKAQRKSKRNTIGDILGNCQPIKILRSINNESSMQLNDIEEENIIENPNEGSSVQINSIDQIQQSIQNIQVPLLQPNQIEINQLSSNRQKSVNKSMKTQQNNLQVNNVEVLNDSSRNEFADSSSSSDSKYFNESITNFQILQSKDNIQIQNESQVQEMIQKKKGFDVIEGEELFHLLYNPFFNEWKAIKDDNITPISNKKNKKKNNFINFNKQSNAFTPNSPDNLVSNTSSAEYQNFSQANDQRQLILQKITQNENLKNQRNIQREKYFMKEVRTFDEVFKSIKQSVNQYEQKKINVMMRKNQRQGTKILNSQQYNNQVSSDEESLDEQYDNQEQDISDEVLSESNQNNFDLNLQNEVLDQQDINQGDRQVLNDRILGIINVFQCIHQNGMSAAQQAKYLKILNELSEKNLSTEKNSQNIAPIKEKKNNLFKNKNQELIEHASQIKPKLCEDQFSNKKVQLNISGSSKELSFGTYVNKKHIGISLPKKKKIV